MISYWRLETLAASCLHYIVLKEGDLEGLCFHQSIIFERQELEDLGLSEEEAAGYVEDNRK